MNMNAHSSNGAEAITFRPIDVFDLPVLPVSIETKYGTNEGLSPRTSARFMYNWVLPMPDLPIANQYIAEHPQCSLFHFDLMSLEDWMVQTGGNSRILMRALESSGRPPLFWKTQLKLQPLDNRPWPRGVDIESLDRSNSPHKESTHKDEEQEEVDEDVDMETIYHDQMDIGRLKTLSSDQSPPPNFWNEEVVDSLEFF